MKTIPLTKNKFAVVDDSDYEWLSKNNWCYSPLGYAVRGTRSRKEGWQRLIYMHREILKTDKTVDHINGDKLDNRRSNLREATQQQQLQNAAIRKDNTSGYRGVTYLKRDKKWRATLYFRGKRKFSKTYQLKEDAANAYALAAKEYFGEFRRAT